MKKTKTIESIFYLIPNVLSEYNAGRKYPAENIQVLENLEVLIAETAKECRKFIKLINTSKPISEFNIIELPKNKHRNDEVDNLNELWDQYTQIGFVSDAGLPCIADPGAGLVNKARKKGFIIRPLVGASSLMMGLMASGFNGQQFCFNGYLPVTVPELKQKLKLMEQEVFKHNITQIFIETPYRNDKLLELLLSELNAELKLSVSANIGGKEEWNYTESIRKWRMNPKYPGKIPAVFLLGK